MYYTFLTLSLLALWMSGWLKLSAIMRREGVIPWRMFIIITCCTFAAVECAAVRFPSWGGPFLDPLLIPFGGVAVANGTTHVNLYRAIPSIGTYNMAPMLAWVPIGDGGSHTFLASWKNSPQDEDQPGQRVLYSVSKDGVTWSATDGTNELFPNMSTTANPAALFAEPTLVINGRVYAAASPTQFCVYPTPFPDQLLLRRVLGLHSLGPLFWASPAIPAGFEAASALNNVSILTEMDTQTQADIATLLDPSQLPWYVRCKVRCTTSSRHRPSVAVSHSLCSLGSFNTYIPHYIYGETCDGGLWWMLSRTRCCVSRRRAQCCCVCLYVGVGVNVFAHRRMQVTMLAVYSPHAHTASRSAPLAP